MKWAEEILWVVEVKRAKAKKAICLLFYCRLHSNFLIFIDFSRIFLFLVSLLFLLKSSLPLQAGKSEKNTKECLCKLILFERANEYSSLSCGGRFCVSFFYSLRNLLFFLLNYFYFFTFFYTETLMVRFGLNRSKVGEGLNWVDRMSTAIISFVRCFHNFSLQRTFPCVFLAPSSQLMFSLREHFPTLCSLTTNTLAKSTPGKRVSSSWRVKIM